MSTAMSTVSFSGRMLTELDHARLSRLIHEHVNDADTRDEFEALMDDADVVAAADIPADVVTMRSRVQVADPDTGETMDWTLCYPQDADAAQGKVSILSPAGASLLGLKVGEQASWLRRDGSQARLRIAAILYQPEASGDYGV